MPTGAEPFAITIGLMLVALVVSNITLRKLDGKITNLRIDSTTKTQLIRSANWYSDSTQALAILVPPVDGLAVGTASGSGWLEFIYGVVIAITFVTLLVFGMSDPLDYGTRLKPNIPITWLGLIGLVINAVALIIVWIGVVPAHPVPAHSAAFRGCDSTETKGSRPRSPDHGVSRCTPG